MTNNLIIPKGDGTLNMGIESLDIYYQKNDWLTNDQFKEEIIKRNKDFKDKDEAFLLHKARTVRYFGLVEYLYKGIGELKGNQGRITIEGKRFLEAFNNNDNNAMIDTIMYCIEKYTFGRNNYGTDGDSDIEMPAILLRASLDLKYITKDESIQILYYMNDLNKDYNETINKIKNLRSLNNEIWDEIDLTNAELDSIKRRYGDNKAAQFMREISIFEDDTSKFKLTKHVEKKYTKAIKKLQLKNTDCSKSNEYKKPNIYFDKFNTYIQKIYFGAPGTGKSYNVSKLIAEEEEEYQSDYVYRTTIYPDYSYHDFIGHVMPVVEEDKITYDFKPGVFTQALKCALKHPNQDIYLVIEEMSRGNISSIFGDVFQLLDRTENGMSEYEINNDVIYGYLEKEIPEITWKEILPNKNKIRIPGNLNILGTINTSDQNVFVMDNAFKRRFEFEYVDIKPIKNEDGHYLNNFKFTLDDLVSGTKLEFNWIDFYQSINYFIINNLQLPEDKQIGQFFIQFRELDSSNVLDSYNFTQLKNKLLLYLWEDIHSVHLSSDKLFSDVYIKSFSNTYDSFSRGICIFSQAFIDIYNKINNLE